MMLKPVEEVSDDSEEVAQSVRASSLKPVSGISSDSADDAAAEQPLAAGQRTCNLIFRLTVSELHGRGFLGIQDAYFVEL